MDERGGERRRAHLTVTQPQRGPWEISRQIMALQRINNGARHNGHVVAVPGMCHEVEHQTGPLAFLSGDQTDMSP